MRRAVVTGMGIASCLGLDKQSVLESLQQARSGIVHRPIYEEMGMRSHVAGVAEMDFSEHIDRKALRFMGDAAAYGYVAMEQAIADAIAESGANSIRDMGKVMGVLKSKYTGQLDFGKVGGVVKAQLS